MKRMILPLLAILLAVGGAFATKSMKYRTLKWGQHSTSGCIQGTLVDDQCTTTPNSNGRCQVQFSSDNSTADAFDVSGCMNDPLYKTN